MEIKEHPFYQVLHQQLAELGFYPYPDSMVFFPIWFNEEKQIFIQGVALSDFSNRKNALSPVIWQDMMLKNRLKFSQYMCIWEDNWLHRRDFIKMYLHQLLHGTFSIFARDLKVGSIPQNVANEFLNMSHILGDAKGKTYLGLFVPPYRQFRGIKSSIEFEGNPLVGVAVFGKTLVMKDEKYVGQQSTELVRFASLPGTRIVGGITKALRFYQKAFLVDNIMTYVDLEWNDGHGFLGMGFEMESLTNPLLFSVNDLKHRSLVENWYVADACNAGNLKLRYELK